jgi:hypothetical protein
MKSTPSVLVSRSHDLQQLLLYAALLFSFATVQAAGPQSTDPASPAQHPILGSWSWTLPGKKCRETLSYRADGTSTGSSGEEATQSRYETTAIPSLLGFYGVAETATVANGKRDCSGDLHEVSGEPVIRFIQFSPRHDQLIVCKAESLKACFGPLKRSDK